MDLFSGNQEETQDIKGSLENLGVPLETKIPKEVLNPAQAKAIRFRTKRPGYSFAEVDGFVRDNVRPTIDWYVNTLYQRDIHVHRLGEALDKAETDILNLRAQAQFLDYNSQIAKGLELGNEDAEVKALMDKLSSTQEELDAANAELQSLRSSDNVNQMLGKSVISSEPLMSEPVSSDPDYSKPLIYSEPSIVGNGESVTDFELQAKLEEQESLLVDLRGKLTSLQSAYDTVLSELETARQQIEASITSAQNSNETVSGSANTDSINADSVNAGSADNSGNTDSSELSPETEAYIVELNSRYSELSAMYEELSTRYQTDVADLQSQIEQDKEALERLQATVATAVSVDESNTGVSESSDEISAATQEYIDELLSRYNVLAEQYTNDTTALQARIDELEVLLGELETSGSAATPPVSTLDGDANTTDTSDNTGLVAENQELREYYEAAVTQYNTLLDMYNQLVEQVEAGGSQITVVQGAEGGEGSAASAEVDLSQYVDIEEYQRVVAENELLREQLAENRVEDESGQDDDDYIPQFILPSDDLKRNVDPQKYGNLPPGILPEDLE